MKNLLTISMASVMVMGAIILAFGNDFGVLLLTVGAISLAVITKDKKAQKKKLMYSIERLNAHAENEFTPTKFNN
jgi:hypothetical protein